MAMLLPMVDAEYAFVLCIIPAGLAPKALKRAFPDGDASVYVSAVPRENNPYAQRARIVDAARGLAECAAHDVGPTPSLAEHGASLP